MKQTNIFLTVTAVILTATLLATGGVFLYIWQNLTGQHIAALTEIGERYLYLLLALAFVIISVIWFGLESVYKNYIHPIKKISAEASIIYSSNPSHRIKTDASRDINALTGIINDFAEMFENLSRDITEQILSSRSEVEREKNLLASIMAELPQGVIICNRSGRILLFNSRAKSLFTHSSHTNRAEHFIGLGRSIFHLIDKDLIAHALEEIEERKNNQKESLASYFITPIYTGILLSIEAIPVLDHKQVITGFILTFKDISDQVDQYENIDNWMTSFRQTLAYHFEQTLLLIDDLIESTDFETKSRRLYEKKITKNLNHIEKQFRETGDNILEATLTRLPLTKLNLLDFLANIQKQAREQSGLQINIKNRSDNKRMLADSYSLNMAFIFLLVNLSEVTRKNEFDLEVSTSNGLIFFDIS